jgi:hypothetical protein
MQKKLVCLGLVLFCLTDLCSTAQAIGTVIWQPLEICLKTDTHYANPYLDVVMWVDLQGPGFKKRVYGFWDGGQTFKVRIVATVPGKWAWKSGSNQPQDNRLNGRNGTFHAEAWSTDEIRENPNRRGIIRATANGHGLEYADGTAFFMVGDTWLAASTWRLPFKGIQPAKDYIPGPGICFEELVAYRKCQGYNSISFIAAFPNWDADHLPSTTWDENGVCIRNAWEKWGFIAEDGKHWTAKDMHDEHGNRPFKMLPDREGIPDYNRLNPSYFTSLDKKMDHLWNQGFICFLEPVRRDCCPAWGAYFNYKTTYARFVQYLIARYGAYNLIFSGIHLDIIPPRTSLPAEDYNTALTWLNKTYGPPPFGQLITTLINKSTYRTFGHGQECPWLTMHTVGNSPRDHAVAEYIEELFRLNPPYPVANMEPYYVGWNNNKPAGERPPRNSERDNYFARAQMYGSVLSGALAGHVFGHTAYDCTTIGEVNKGERGQNRGARPYIWEALLYESGIQMQYLRSFITSEGGRYQQLLLASHDLEPRTAPGSHPRGLDGWAYMMRTQERDLAFLYFENKAIRAVLKDFHPKQSYQLDWYDPRCGKWIPSVLCLADEKGSIKMPAFPGRLDIAQTDWAVRLKIIH